MLDDPQLVDAVPEGGHVRFVTAEARRNGHIPQLPELEGITVRPADPRFEDGFMVLLRKAVGSQPIAASLTLARPPAAQGNEAVVEVRDLVRKFGSFIAVNHVNFEVHRGEIFGLLGPNGAGKTTTFRMLCGLLAASGGTLRVAGVDLHSARASARQQIGYVAQKFSLYGQLSVIENLDFFGSAYGLRGSRKAGTHRMGAADSSTCISTHGCQAPSFPGGFKQRLSMAAALLHEPELLFLDEPTSGVDPLARREFWRRITALAQQGVTVIVTTHFMEEAEYCDRIAIMDAGRVLAEGTPAEVRRRAHPKPGQTPTMEDAFIAIVDESRSHETANSHE